MKSVTSRTGTSRHRSEERGSEERNVGYDRIIHYRQVQYYRYPEKNVAEAAKYLEDHPEVNLIITGYADVQTGNPAYNLKLSQRRAEAVCNMMVKEFGVDPSRIRVDYKGDSLQPYQLKNEWNRVVVFITEARNK